MSPPSHIAISSLIMSNLTFWAGNSANNRESIAVSRDRILKLKKLIYRSYWKGVVGLSPNTYERVQILASVIVKYKMS